MTEALPLTYAFLEHQPEAAARAIDELEAADAAAFLEAVPAALAGPVLSRMTAWGAAGVVALLPPEPAAGMVREMVYLDAVSLLRLMSPEAVEALLQSLPRRLARDFRRSLDYPIQSVGAWMDQSIPSFAASGTVAEASRFLRRPEARALSHLFLVDDNRRFAGAVGVNRLLLASAETVLGTLVDEDIRPLANREPLRDAARPERWDSCLVLPVVGARDNVLGGLPRQALRQGLAAQEKAPRPAAPDALAMQLFEGYFVACAGLLRLVLPPAEPAPKG